MNKILIAMLALFSLSGFAQINSVNNGSVIEAQKINELITKINALEQKVVKVGSVVIMPANCPVGYRLANGDSLNRSDFPALFAVIGTSHGYDSSTNFFLPDYRGRFLRGLDGGSANDPDAATRTAMKINGNTGNNIGSIQGDQNKEHTHSLTRRSNPDLGAYDPADGQRNTNAVSTTDRPILGSFSVTNSGGSESRPKNIYVNYCIKVN